MLTGATGSAVMSACGRCRFTLARIWDERPVLLVVMFNPAKADATVQDATVTLLCHIAAHNGYGGIVVVNGVPLRSSKPETAAEIVNTWERTRNWEWRDMLTENIGHVRDEVSRAGAVLLAWGALADLCPDWFDHVLEQIREELQPGTPLYCLGKTAGGHPKHPMARGKHKVPKDAPLLPWA